MIDKAHKITHLILLTVCLILFVEFMIEHKAGINFETITLLFLMAIAFKPQDN